MVKNPIIIVHAEWDPEAGVYVATSDDVPGLVAEAATPSALQEKLNVLIPELLELNGVLIAGTQNAAAGSHVDISVVLRYEQVTTLRVLA